jgi:VWFA-related protein
MGTSKRSTCFVQVLLALALAAFAFIGCSGGGGTSGGGNSGGGSSTAPEITLSTTQLDFSGVVIDNFSDRSITVQNTGTAALTIGQIAQLSAPFAIVEDNCSGASLSPSGTCSIKIQFSPTNQNSYTGSFNIASNDSDENPVAVTLSGLGRGLNVSINRIDKDTCPTQKLKLLISVADKTGSAVLGLQGNNFVLFEDGQLITPFVLTIPPLQLPVSVGLVLDYSSSMIPFTTDLEAAAISFLDQLDFPNDEAEIIKFARNIYVTQAFTTNKPLLVSAVNSVFPDVRSGTSFYDAVWQSIDNTAARTNSRLAVIAVSDGDDQQSTNTLDELIAHAVEKGVPVFTIGIGTVNAEQMQRLARETGGQYFLAPASSDLQAVYLQISQILSNQYLIEYTTPSSGGNTVSLDVEVEDNIGLQGEGSKDAAGC